MKTESVFFYVRCARPIILCKPELNLLKSGEENAVQLRNWESDDKEGPSWSNTKSIARYKSIIQKA